MPYWRLFYHIVWSTHGREPQLYDPVQQLVQGAILRKADELGVRIHGIGGADDHLHLVASIPPSRPVSQVVGALKGASARYANERLSGTTDHVCWQGEYSVLTVSERALPRVLRYVADQRAHHADPASLVAEMERVGVD